MRLKALQFLVPQNEKQKTSKFTKTTSDLYNVNSRPSPGLRQGGSHRWMDVGRDLTSMQHTTSHTIAVQSPSHYQYKEIASFTADQPPTDPVKSRYLQEP